MSNRLDILIFGATGYTGQYVVEEMARKGKQFGLKWGVAGRTIEKLKQILQQASKNTKIENLSSNIDKIVANVTDQQSLNDMCNRTKILINCVGPYRHFGESVVQACLKTQTNYIDICGEPQFLETIQYRYDNEAKERQIVIIGSCGFDSLIADMGVETIRQEYQRKNLEISLIESFLSMNYPKITNGLIHYATWESAVYGFSHGKELKDLRRKIFTEKLRYPKLKIVRKPIFKTMIDGKSIWAVPFPGSDRSVVQRTQYFNFTQSVQQPIRFQPYLEMSSFISVIKLVFFGLIFVLFTKFQLGIQCLLKFPRLFSGGLVTHEGPARSDCENSTFKMKFVAHAENNQRTIHEFSGPDAGYLGTSKMLIACAIILNQEKDRLPVQGGVLTPGAAFGHTTLMDYLNNEGISLIQK